MSDTTLTEAIAEVTQWRNTSTTVAQRLRTTGDRGASYVSEDRAQAFQEVINYLERLDTASSEPVADDLPHPAGCDDCDRHRADRQRVRS